uniref:Uncharacterized protein n=1 Tax=Anguilla anguilla TaxID=7936 RepID=A0A0E9RKK1_ANGAN
MHNGAWPCFISGF